MFLDHKSRQAYMQIDLLHPKIKLSIFKSSFFVVCFIFISAFLLFASAYSLSSLDSSKSREPQVKSATTDRSGVSVYASLPETKSTIDSQVIAADARVIIVQRFLQSYGSPLAEHANTLVSSADKYGLDYKLLPAIAMKESGGCKAIPANSHNCWGWGIHSEGSLGFDSYDEGIETVSSGLKEYYIDLGYETVEDIMTKYAHKDSTTWADGVNFYIDQIE